MESSEQISTELQLTEAQKILAKGIENFRPKCIVCASEVPLKRAKSRNKDTCSPECHQVLKKFRKWVIVSAHCPACYHPSTPEERKAFIEWRKHRGDRRERPGKPPKPVAIARLWKAESEWSQQTFGPDKIRGPIGPLKHLEKESREAQESPQDLKEYSDCLLLILDATRRAGFSLEELVEAAENKVAENKTREWPDWKTLPTDAAIEHKADREARDGK